MQMHEESLKGQILCTNKAKHIRLRLDALLQVTLEKRRVTAHRLLLGKRWQLCRIQGSEKLASIRTIEQRIIRLLLVERFTDGENILKGAHLSIHHRLQSVGHRILKAAIRHVAIYPMWYGIRLHVMKERI